MDIVIQNLCKAFGENIVLENFSCRIPAGRVTCVEGPSGQGKTTLLRILMGLETADSGRVEGLEGQRISAVFQDGRLCENLSAYSNVKMVCGKEVHRRDIQREFAALGLEGSMQQPARELSGGQQQRVALLRAALAEHDLLLLDEPFSALDGAMKETVAAWLLEKSRGKTVVLVSHDEAECLRMGGSGVNLKS